MRGLLFSFCILTFAQVKAIDLSALNSDSCKLMAIGTTGIVTGSVYSAFKASDLIRVNPAIAQINQGHLLRLQGDLILQQPFSSKKLYIPNFHLVLLVKDRDANFLNLPEILWRLISENTAQVTKPELLSELKHMIHIINTSNSFDANTVHYRVNFLDHVNGDRPINFNTIPEWSEDMKRMSLSDLADFIQKEFKRIPSNGIIAAHTQNIKALEKSKVLAKYGIVFGIMGAGISTYFLSANNLSYQDCQ